MAMNFMKIDQVVMSGDGFFQSMAYHAYQSLPLGSFSLQCLLCVLSIATGYAVRPWVLVRLTVRGPWSVYGYHAVQVMGPAVVAVWCLSSLFGAAWLYGLNAHELMVLWKVLSLTLWVLVIRSAGWFFRYVLHPHEVLRIFLHLIEWAAVVVAVLTFFGLFQPLISHIQAIEFSIGEQVFKGANIVTGVLMGVVALTVAGQIADVVDRLLQRYARQETIQGNDALILTRLFSMGIFVFTLVGVLVSSGIDLTTLAAFAGAMGIGLGFGLQEFVVNYVSGLYVLLERALKVGDYVTIDKITGRVVQMSSRALVVRDAVGTESLIPNSSVIKGVLQNHTLSNDDFRVSFLLKIADVADYPRARELILQSLKNAPRVLPDPAGDVLIASVAAGEVTLETSFWINDLHNGHKGLISDLMFDICMRFRSEGVLLASEGVEPLAATKPHTSKTAAVLS
ncbi:mechanosensitive ion channel family protein [Limnohabitans sp. DM1]|uniref:mechanosensitive ion channel family protein n=1 Tax=Limnohabitans sp. DM1 TaxID=1597955 RepID=UPI000B077023|nr:mechanosensitive ion channel domain-containing protein [Limnohabitans sp. DM1]